MRYLHLCSPRKASNDMAGQEGDCLEARLAGLCRYSWHWPIRPLDRLQLQPGTELYCTYDNKKTGFSGYFITITYHDTTTRKHSLQTLDIST